MSAPDIPRTEGADAARPEPASKRQYTPEEIAQIVANGSPFPLTQLTKLKPGWTNPPTQRDPKGNAELIHESDFDGDHWRLPFARAAVQPWPEAINWKRPNVILRPTASGFQARHLLVRPQIVICVAPLFMLEINDPLFVIPAWLAMVLNDLSAQGKLTVQEGEQQRSMTMAEIYAMVILRPGYEIQRKQLAQRYPNEWAWDYGLP